MLDLLLPVLLQRVERLQWHLEQGRLLYELQLLQDAAEVWPAVGLGVPALWGESGGVRAVVWGSSQRALEPYPSSAITQSNGDLIKAGGGTLGP